MAGTIKHRFQSAVADAGEAGMLGPDEWNDSLVASGGTNGDIFLRNTVAADGWSLLASAAASQVLTSGGAGSAPSWSATPTLTSLTLSGLTANSFLYSGAAGALTTTAAPTNGQLLIGSTAVAPVLGTITGTANRVTVTNGAGTITLSGPQDLATSSVVQFGAIGVGASPAQGNYFSTVSASTAYHYVLDRTTTGVRRWGWFIDSNGNLSLDDITGVATRLTMTPTGSLLVNDGAIGAPGIGFINDPDTGLYRVDANKIRITVGGVITANISSTEWTGPASAWFINNAGPGNLTINPQGGDLVVQPQIEGKQLVAGSTATTNAAVTALKVRQDSSGIAAINFGPQIGFEADDAGGTIRSIANIRAVWNNLTGLNLGSRLEMLVNNNSGTTATPLAVYGDSGTYAVVLTGATNIIGTLAVSNTVTLSIPLAIASGGTGQTTKAAAYDALSPMTTLGDLIYGGAAGTGTRLAGNTSATKQYLTQTGTGVVSAAPTWATIADADLPATIVRTSRLVSTTAPLAGGGDLSADRTLSITGLTSLGAANQLTGVNAGATGWEYKTLSGTANRVTVTNGAGTITLSGPQDLATSSTVQFGAIGVGSSPAQGNYFSTVSASTAYHYVLDRTTTGVRRWGWFIDGSGGLNLDDITGVATRLGISAGGAVTFPSVGTTANAANAYLDNVASNNLLRSTSSLRYKTTVAALDERSAVDLIMGLRPIRYHSLAKSDPVDREYVGFGAEDVATLDDRFVTRDPAGRPDWVMYQALTAPLVSVAQSHEHQIAVMLTRIDELESEIRALRARHAAN